MTVCTNVAADSTLYTTVGTAGTATRSNGIMVGTIMYCSKYVNWQQKFLKLPSFWSTGHW